MVWCIIKADQDSLNNRKGIFLIFFLFPLHFSTIIRKYYTRDSTVTRNSDFFYCNACAHQKVDKLFLPCAFSLTHTHTYEYIYIYCRYTGEHCFSWSSASVEPTCNL